MKTEEKQKAIVLRKKGKSISEISDILNVARSSVSVWVRDIKLNLKQKQNIDKKLFGKIAVEKRRITRLKNEKEKKLSIIRSASQQIKTISDRDLKLIGIMIYWAEGCKTLSGSVRISNSDPAMIITMMEFFKKICLVPKSKFRGHIHTHSHLSVKKAEEFWSKISGIPLKQFYKTYCKTSIAGHNKRETTPFGTFEIYVNNTRLFFQIIGWIEKTKKIVLNKRYKKEFMIGNVKYEI